MNVALATFVKTPELSPVKTRLAATIGTNNARRFYTMSVACIQDLMESLARQPHITPLWAVAEPEGEGNGYWHSFPIVYQGSGSLGERLHQVYSILIAEFDAVVFIGADSPHLSEEHILRAITLLESSPVVIGPASDGGFYLFAGREPLEASFWNRIPYSTSDTLNVLLRELPEDLKPMLLPVMADVDHWKDLGGIVDGLRELRTDSAHHLADWIETLLGSERRMK
ncbi:MAG: DUF2064 domain-containing protein [Fidelibacterota bacterium]